jgi:hypothetical protein
MEDFTISLPEAFDDCALFGIFDGVQGIFQILNSRRRSSKIFATQFFRSDIHKRFFPIKKIF